MRNCQWTLARKPPGGWPVADDFAWSELPLPTPSAGQMLTRTLYLSLDPYQWGRRRGGVEAVGEVCHGRTVSQVVESRIDGYRPGDFVFNTNGWQTHGLTGDGISVFGYMFPRKLDPSVAPLSTAVGVMGMLGLTAYAGLVVQCEPRLAETVVVSAASGGVGQVVGQIAKIMAVASSASPARRRSAVSSSTNWVTTPAFHTAARHSWTILPPPVPTASTSISKTSAAKCSKRCCRT